MSGEAISVEGESGTGMTLALRKMIEFNETDWQAIKFPYGNDRARKNTRTFRGVNASR